MKNILVISPFILALSGCAIFPQSQEELLTNGNKAAPMCFSQDKEFVESRVKAYLAKCFKPTFVFTSGTTGYNLNYYVDEKILGDSTVYNVYSPSGSNKGFFLNTKVSESGDSCPTRIDITVFNTFWENNFKKIQDSIEGETASCPM